MVDEKGKEDCCGCRACAIICPLKAITMIEDEKGFKYPKIDFSLCDECGACDKICGFHNHYKNHGDNPKVLAIKHKVDSIRGSSTSGGVFVAISDHVLQQNGVVYGVGFDKKFYIRHKKAETSEERDEFKGSKYVQSDLGDTYLQIRKDLNQKRMVLFTGTPCQVAGLNSYLRRDYERLFTQDIICHGTPSNKLWLGYISIIEKANQNKIEKFIFRDKTLGWHQTKIKIIFKNKQTKKIKGEQSYFQLFNPNLMLMPACHNCKFRNFRRPSDITLGDFWGIEKTMPEFDDNKGVSLVLINSPRGNELINSISDKLIIKESVKEDCAQDQIREPVPKNKKSDQFWNDYQKYGMEYVMIKYTDYNDMITFLRKSFGKLKRIFGV